MKTFKVKKFDDNGYPYIVFSTSYEDPFDDIDDIEKELDKFTGKVLFDLLLTNGLASNRFVEAKVESGHLDTSSFKVLKNINGTVKRKITEFYLENLHLLDNSILNKAQKYLIKQGRI